MANQDQFGDDVEGLTILGALSQLKNDIYQLQDENERDGREGLFEIEGGELELKLVARREKSARGGGKTRFRLYLFDLEFGGRGEGKRATEALQTLRIKFRGLSGLSRAEPGQGEVIRGASPQILGSSQTRGPIIQVTQPLPTGIKGGGDVQG